MLADPPNEQVLRGFVPPELVVADVLRLIGAGAGAQILMTLGQGPLRTKQLTERVQDFSPRSVYRCVNLMSSHGLVDRYEQPGVPSTVLLRLSEPAGRNLFRLLRSFPSPSEEPLSLVGELWELDFFQELSWAPRPLIELAEGSHGLTYHQVKRRMQLFMADDLLNVSSRNGKDRQYELTDRGRRCVALVTAIGRWRHRHVVAEGMPGLKPAEMATVLRTALPLIALPEQAGASIDLVVAGDADRYGRRDTETVRGTVDCDGALYVDRDSERPADGSAAATLNTWFVALLDGARGRIGIRGDRDLVDACLTELHDVVGSTSPSSSRRDLLHFPG
jgi:DNA-binding HxlR family transcriptional regulator